MLKFGSPEPIQPEPEEGQGVDVEHLRREAARTPYDPAAVVDEAPAAPEPEER